MKMYFRKDSNNSEKWDVIDQDFISYLKTVSSIQINNIIMDKFILDDNAIGQLIDNTKSFNNTIIISVPTLGYKNSDRVVELSVNDVIKAYERNKDILSDTQLLAYKKIIYYLGYEYYKQFLSERICGVTYEQIIDELKKNVNEIDDQYICGVKTEDIIDYLSGFPLFLPIRGKNNSEYKFGYLDRANLSLLEKNNIIVNYNRLYFKYSKDKVLNEFKQRQLYVDEFDLNDELKEEVLKDIPDNFNKLQVAYYIYKKLCQCLHYDEEYYATNQKPFDDKKYKDIKELNRIKPGDGVVCYQITMIFAKFCKMLDIPFRLEKYENAKVLKYGGGHLLLVLNVDGYIVKADFATGIISCDMVTEKVYGKVKFFSLENEVERRKQAYDLFIKEADDYFSSIENYEDAKKQYQEMTKNDLSKLSIRERLEIFIDIIKKIDLNIMDSILLVSKIYKNIFSGLYFKNCIFRAIANRNTTNSDMEAEVVFLIAFNENKISDDFLENEYYVIDAYKNVEKVSPEDLKERFDSGIYDYLDDEKLLGIEGGNGEKRSIERYKK